MSEKDRANEPESNEPEAQEPEEYRMASGSGNPNHDRPAGGPAKVEDDAD